MAGGARKLIDGVKRAVTTERDALTLEIIYELARRPPLGTPVLTGWARANWIPQLGGEVSQRTIKKPSQGGPAMAGARQQSAIAALLAQGAGRPDEVVHVYNPVPYVNRLNNGWSKQSPPLFVEAAVTRAIDTRATAQRARRVKL